MEKLKVLHCYKTYYPATYGGIEQVIFQLSEAVTAAGGESMVFCVNNPEGNKVEPFHGHYVYRAKKSFEIASTPFSFEALNKFSKLAKQYDIIHYHFPYPFMDMLHFASGIKKPTIVSYHSDIIKQKSLMKLYNPLMNCFLSDVDKIVAASPNYLKSSDVLQKYIKKVSIIPYGIPDITKFETNSVTDLEISEKFPLGYFLFVGSFRYYKGLHFLLEAMKGTDIPIVLLGASGEEKKLKDFTKNNKMNNIHFVGAREDAIKYSYLSKAVGFVFPSHLRSEAFGISLVEAACFNLPLICCEIGTGTSYININDETGIVVDGGNVDQLKQAIITLWNDPTKRSCYGGKARKRYEETFTSEQMANAYLDLYKEVIGQYNKENTGL